MKKILLALGLATGLTTGLFAGETLHLNLVPDRDVLLKGRPQEVVVKIDLSAIADRQRHRHKLCAKAQQMCLCTQFVTFQCFQLPNPG